MGTRRAPPSAGRHTRSQPSSSPQSLRCSASCSCRDVPHGDSRQGIAVRDSSAAHPAQGKEHRKQYQLIMGKGGRNNQGFGWIQGVFCGVPDNWGAPWSTSPRGRGRCTAPRRWFARRRHAGAQYCRERRAAVPSRRLGQGPQHPHAVPGPLPPTLAAARATVPPGPCKACRAPLAVRKPEPRVVAAQPGGCAPPRPGNARGPGAVGGTRAPLRGQDQPW